MQPFSYKQTGSACALNPFSLPWKGLADAGRELGVVK